MHFDIKVGSVTNAQRATRLLRSKGIKANFHRMDNPLPQDGCGYAVSVSDKSVALQILQNANIKVLGVEQI